MDVLPGVGSCRVEGERARPLFRLTHGPRSAAALVESGTGSSLSSPSDAASLLSTPIVTLPFRGPIGFIKCMDESEGEGENENEGEARVGLLQTQPRVLCRPRSSNAVFSGGSSNTVSSVKQKRRPRALSFDEVWDALEDIPSPKPVTLRPHFGASSPSSARGNFPSPSGTALGSNAVMCPRDSVAFEFSTGELVECVCCIDAHEAAWTNVAAQRARKKILAALARGWFDCAESSPNAIEALLQVPAPNSRAAKIVRIDAEAAAVAAPTLPPPPPFALPLSAESHARIRARLLRDALEGRLVAEFSPDDKPVLWILVASEWEGRAADANARHCSTEAAVSAVGWRKSARVAAAPTRKGYGHESDDDDGNGDGNDDGDGGETGAGAGAGAGAGTGAGAGVGPLRRDRDQRGLRGIPAIFRQMGGLVGTITYRLVLVDVAAIATIPVPADAPSLDTLSESPFERRGSVTFLDTVAVLAPALSILTNSTTTPCHPTPPPFLSLETGASSVTTASVTTSVCGFRIGAAAASGGGSGAPPRTSGRARSHKHYGTGIGPQPFTRAAVADLLVRLRYTAPSFIETSHDRGRYVCAGGFIPRGAIFCEYGGQLVSAAEGNVREERYARAGDALYGCYSYFFAHPLTRVDHCCDATAERREYGVGRLLSHSKKAPNLHVSAVLVDGVPRLVLSASKDIVFGAELFFDYGDRRTDALENFAWLKA